MGFVSNALLVAVKFSAGFAGNSQALIADGLNSLLDIVAGAVSLIGYRVASRPPDRTHHYGHQNAETIAALVVGLAILATGGIIVRDAIVTVISGSAVVPAAWTVAVAAGVIILKLMLYFYTRHVARRTRSPAVNATAADHLADVIATGGALIGVAGAQMGWPWLDPLAAFWVAAVILYNALRIIRENTSVLLGGAPPEKTMRAIVRTLQNVPGVRGLHHVKARTAGAQLLVDTEVLVDGELTVEEAHAIATAAGDRVLAEHASVVDVMVHVEPHTAERAAEGADPLTPRRRKRGTRHEEEEDA
ncbi:MAG TPA: cation diffusion facilitator family transporter [Acidobacteriota bacterium]|nr:cation diffusion facilitator family transporter [Acidobacteriota bacterium]